MLRIYMIFIKACAELPVEICHDTTGNGHAHSQDIDEDKNFILDNAPKRDENVVLKHKQQVMDLQV